MRQHAAAISRIAVHFYVSGYLERILTELSRIRSTCGSLLDFSDTVVCCPQLLGAGYGPRRADDADHDDETMSAKKMS